MAQKCMLTITLTATVHCMCVHVRAYAHGTLSFCSGADVFDRVSTFLETLYRDMQKGTRGWEGVGGCGSVYIRLGATLLLPPPSFPSLLFSLPLLPLPPFSLPPPPPFHCLSLFANVSAYVHPTQVSVVRMPSL